MSFLPKIPALHSILTAHSDAFFWATVCIIPRNFAINSSVFEPIWFTAEPIVEVCLSRLGLVILWSLWLYLWLSVRLLSVAAEAPSWFVLALLPLDLVLASEADLSRPGIKELQVFFFCYRTVDGRSRFVRVSAAWISWFSLLKITEYLVRFASCSCGVLVTCSISHVVSIGAWGKILSVGLVIFSQPHSCEMMIIKSFSFSNLIWKIYNIWKEEISLVLSYNRSFYVEIPLSL